MPIGGWPVGGIIPAGIMPGPMLGTPAVIIRGASKHVRKKYNEFNGCVGGSCYSNAIVGETHGCRDNLPIIMGGGGCSSASAILSASLCCNLSIWKYQISLNSGHDNNDHPAQVSIVQI